MNHKMSGLIGAGIGLAVFLAIGLLPAVLYGGYAGVLLAGGILGTPLHATWLVRGFVVLGMVLGTASVASLFTVLGATIGTGIGVVLGKTTAARTTPAAN